MSASESVCEKQFMFGPYPLPGANIFYETDHCIAFTNLSCVFPGHVLVATIKPYLKFIDLPDDVRDDFAMTVRFVSKMLQAFYQQPITNNCFQNGESAGMTVPHHHYHILPQIKDKYPEYISFMDTLPREQNKYSEILVHCLRDRAEMCLEAKFYREFIRNGFKPREKYEQFLTITPLKHAADGKKY